MHAVTWQACAACIGTLRELGRGDLADQVDAACRPQGPEMAPESRQFTPAQIASFLTGDYARFEINIIKRKVP